MSLTDTRSVHPLTKNEHGRVSTQPSERRSCYVILFVASAEYVATEKGTR
jgi:hypothetical protein